MLRINGTTGIETRPAIRDYETGFGTETMLRTIADTDALFRTAGVELTVQACNKALGESTLNLDDFTHTMAVTCTNQGNPGFDFLVNEKLNSPCSVDRTLLHGIGCAGGLADMRTAAQLACAVLMRGRPARILCFACELTTPGIRYELDAAANCADLSKISIASTLFSDAAAAFVLCNDLSFASIPETISNLESYRSKRYVSYQIGWFGMTMLIYDVGYRTVLNKTVPTHTVAAVVPMFQSLLLSIRLMTDCDDLDVANFNWALHPGGQASIDGVQKAMRLSDEQLRVTREIYKTRGNSSSPTVLAILDRLRSRNKDKVPVVATAFGPGLSIEMAFLRVVPA
ncbi:unnamed protein product [Aureobasidium uvarum]|uniref:Chalcone synthase n=1 Tax=Aureobasidium uvarum TaxID=2773716 RepID=A0A9N8KET3_9PEZI|nr:unnamed protein product [Aureobasidium uvarum]